MVLGWINAYPIPDWFALAFWGFAGFLAITLFGFQLAAVWNAPPKTQVQQVPKRHLNVRVLPEGNTWSPYTRNQKVIYEISKIAIQVASGPVVRWESIYPLVTSQEARDVVRNCEKLYLFHVPADTEADEVEL